MRCTRGIPAVWSGSRVSRPGLELCVCLELALEIKLQGEFPSRSHCLCDGLVAVPFSAKVSLQPLSIAFEQNRGKYNRENV